MTRHFCTLFDSFYLAKGLALYESLSKHCADFELIVFAFDQRASHILGELKLPRLKVITLEEFETKELLSVKPTRSKGEYCWTSTPFILRHCLEKLKLPQITYLDADLYFFSSPEILLREFEEAKGSSVLITEHRYTPKYDQSKTSGIYCVQFMTFQNDTRGKKVLDWWCQRCLEWCYNRFEDGKFGDQKYLDDWTTRFEGVHVLKHLGGGVAPWNIQQYEFRNLSHQGKLGSEHKEAVELRANSGLSISPSWQPLVFYHFHLLALRQDKKFDLCQSEYDLAENVRTLIYKPYLEALRQADRLIQPIDSDPCLGRVPMSFKTFARGLKRRISGHYYVTNS